MKAQRNESPARRDPAAAHSGLALLRRMHWRRSLVWVGHSYPTPCTSLWRSGNQEQQQQRRTGVSDPHERCSGQALRKMREGGTLCPVGAGKIKDRGWDITSVADPREIGVDGRSDEEREKT